MSDQDEIDRITKQWERERPDLDSSGFQVVGRVIVLADVLKRRVSAALEPLGLSLWAFDVLATLRRQGEPYELTPTELSRATMLTSGAMTNRLDRLESAGWIRRERDPNDRRGIRVVLTSAGLQIVDKAIAVRFAEATSAVQSLSAKDQAILAKALRDLITGTERGGE